jgi:hypothetical protein
MMWLIISQSTNPFYMQRDVNRLSVEIYDQNYKNCSECINQLIYAIKTALSDNFIEAKYSQKPLYDGTKQDVIYIKLRNYTEKDSLVVDNVLKEKGVSDYVIRH